MDLHLSAALAALALLGAAPAPPGPKSTTPAPPPMVWSEMEGEPGVPQRGAPADQALWRSMQADHHQTIAERGLAHRLYYRLRPEREDAGLVALAKEQPALAPKVEALRKRLQAARQVHFRLMSVQWPVDPRRGCRSEMLDLAGRHGGAAGPGRRVVAPGGARGRQALHREAAVRPRAAPRGEPGAAGGGGRGGQAPARGAPVPGQPAAAAAGPEQAAKPGPRAAEGRPGRILDRTRPRRAAAVASRARSRASGRHGEARLVAGAGLGALHGEPLAPDGLLGAGEDVVAQVAAGLDRAPPRTSTSLRPASSWSMSVASGSWSAASWPRYSVDGAAGEPLPDLAAEAVRHRGLELGDGGVELPREAGPATPDDRDGVPGVPELRDDGRLDGQGRRTGSPGTGRGGGGSAGAGVRAGTAGAREPALPRPAAVGGSSRRVRRATAASARSTTATAPPRRSFRDLDTSTSGERSRRPRERRAQSRRQQAESSRAGDGSRGPRRVVANLKAGGLGEGAGSRSRWGAGPPGCFGRSCACWAVRPRADPSLRLARPGRPS